MTVFILLNKITINLWNLIKLMEFKITNNEIIITVIRLNTKRLLLISSVYERLRSHGKRSSQKVFTITILFI